MKMTFIKMAGLKKFLISLFNNHIKKENKQLLLQDCTG